MMPDLKPCPFCGTNAVLFEVYTGNKPMYQVACGNDGCRIAPMTAYLSKRAVAVRDWNRRVNNDTE